MSLLTVVKLLDEVIDEIPNKEQAVIVRAVNHVIRRIQTEYLEPKRSTFTTKAKATTGTITATIDSTAVTLTSAVLASTDPVVLIQIEGDSTWFVLTYVSTTTGTLSSKWAQATASGLTYTIAYPTVSFPSGVGRIIKIQRAGYDPLLHRIGGTCPEQIGAPASYSPYYHDEASAAPSDDLLRYYLDPAPDSRQVYSYWHHPRTTYLDPAGATSQTVPLPDVWDEAVVAGTLFWCWKHEARKEQALLHSALYEAALARARASADGAVILEPKTPGRGLYATEERPINPA